MDASPELGYYDALEFNAPLSTARADRLATALAARRPRTILDVGCGWGELLLRVVGRADGATGTGIDVDGRALERGRQNASARGLGERVQFLEGAAPTDAEPADLVICIGADHAYGTQREALHALSRLARAGGYALFGTGFWETAPSPQQAAAVDLTPEALLSLDALVDSAVEAGFRPLRIETANRDEWDAFESGYLADWEEWLHANRRHPAAAEIAERANGHRRSWLAGYRNVLGFAYLTLGR